MAKIVFISCVSKKLPRLAAARDLYVSDLFKKCLAYAQSLKPRSIYVLSAKYGLLPLDKKVAPYEQTLNTMKSKDVQKWAGKVLEQMRKEKINFDKDEAVFLAGAKYRKFLMPQFTHATAPLSKFGIGKQLAFLKHAVKK